MPPLELSTAEADFTKYEPFMFGIQGQSTSINHDFEQKTGVSGLDQLTKYESDSDQSSENVETYPHEELSSSSSLLHFHDEKSIDKDPSNNNSFTMLNSNKENHVVNKSIAKTDCYQCSHLRSTPRRVNFSPKMEEVIEIPSHRVLEPHVKEDLYMSLRIIHAEAIRNRKEWDYERRNTLNVVEESEFIPDCNGNLWHPAHWNPII